MNNLTDQKTAAFHYVTTFVTLSSKYSEKWNKNKRNDI